MSTLTRRTIRQAWGVSNRARLLLALAVGVAALTFVAVAWAATWVQYVGSGGCAEKVWPGSDQIDDGFSYNYETLAYTDSDQCSHIEVPGYMRVYENKPDGSWSCNATGYGHVECITSSWPYTRSHCVNLSDSIRWMECYKYKQ